MWFKEKLINPRFVIYGYINESGVTGRWQVILILKGLNDEVIIDFKTLKEARQYLQGLDLQMFSWSHKE